jgi:hypothetical protein
VTKLAFHPHVSGNCGVGPRVGRLVGLRGMHSHQGSMSTRAIKAVIEQLARTFGWAAASAAWWESW